jgi:hypothetical protein
MLRCQTHDRSNMAQKNKNMRDEMMKTVETNTQGKRGYTFAKKTDISVVYALL